MRKDEKPSSEKVGYGKPPKATQFQKGISGNPKGRPKKARNFDSLLMKESESLIPVNENGRRTHISKQEALIKQLVNKAIAGNMHATRTYLKIYLPAIERFALSVARQTEEIERRKDARYLTDEELMEIAAGGLKKIESGT